MIHVDLILNPRSRQPVYHALEDDPELYYEPGNPLWFWLAMGFSLLLWREIWELLKLGWRLVF